MRTAAENLIGQVLDGRYHIERKLDAGGISAVYVAKDNRLVDKKVVVKVLLEESYKNEYVVTKFRQEIEALARLRHPNIVDILDSGTLPDGMPYIVLEFIKGASLRTLIRPEGGDLVRAGHIIRQAASALTAAHENGILHRDLKPENIMLRQLDDGEEQVKVIDFGIAKIENSVVAPETAVVATAGTIAYMSPEQLSATKLSPASDIFSLGVVAYELLTGQKPFRPQTPFQLLEMHRAGVTALPRELRPAVSETAQMVLLKALAFDPNERYLKARDFGDDLFETLTGLPGRTGRLNSVVRPPADATSVYATTPVQRSTYGTQTPAQGAP
ncbi:MAG TPA: serine/threonine-protein kinase, partial [Pyrinomonadaceae bacterium]|nr:serine/threonine-protein kinase [Pyrinomonadaceae bacterium]